MKTYFNEMENENKNITQITKANGTLYTVRLKRDRIFSPDEWNLFYNSLPKKSKPLFLCLINTGGRINEILNIKKKDIDFTNNLVSLKITKKHGFFSTGNPRTFKISSQYSCQLKEFVKNLKEEDKLFKVSRQSAWRLMQRHLKQLDIKNYQDFSIHNIRKTFECWLNFLGNNHLLILKHLGHNQSTALRYYLTTDIYTDDYKLKARQILGDLYATPRPEVKIELSKINKEIASLKAKVLYIKKFNT